MLSTNKNILITGVAGFIGFHTAMELLKNNCKIIGIDNLNDYYPIELKKYRLNELKKHSDFTFYQIDIEHKKELERVFNKYQIDAVINLAARAGIRYSIEYPELYFQTNLIGLLNLLDIMKEKKIENLITASTSSVYSGQETPFHELLPVNKPISPYAASKKAAEMLAYTYYHLYNINIKVLRYFTVYGPAGRPDMCIFKFIRKIDKGEPIQIYGDGNQKRDFTYVEDIAKGTIMALATNGFEIINLGGGKSPYTLHYLVELIENYLQKKAIIEYQAFKKEDMHETYADISKAKQLLNWEPVTNFETGISYTVNWYLSNKLWLDNIHFK